MFACCFSLAIRKISLVATLRLTIGCVFAAEASGLAQIHYDLHQPCCSNDGLWGTRASIRTPSSVISVGGSGCVLYRSDADGPSGGLIQTGFVACAANTNLDGTCATTNKQVQFVEIVDGAGYHCYSHGAIGASVNALYSVTSTSPSSATWRAYINGVDDGHTTSFGSAGYLVEGAELTATPCNGSFSGTTTFGVTQAWQRWNSVSWVTVGSAYTTGNGCGFSFSGGPTGQWSISH